MSGPAPQQRNVLVNLGNRYVAFGPSRPSPFRPEQVTEVLPRVSDESEVAETRIIESLQVLGFNREKTQTTGDSGVDVVLEDGAGNKLFVVAKVSGRNPTSNDLRRDADELRSLAIDASRVELWRFNIEQLALFIEWMDDGKLEHTKLPALDVFERTPTGVFPQSRVIERVDSWQLAVEDLYSRVADWVSAKPELRVDRSRSVVIGEELMQRFDVADREVPILDVLDDLGVALSFVPRAIWIIGARGRVDLISRQTTRMLVLVGKDEAAEWHLVNSQNRRETSPFTKEHLLAFTGEA